MPIPSYLRRFRSASQQPRGRPLWLESLEDRSVPSIIFNNATTAITSDGGGPVINQVHVELIFWGSGWDTGQGTTLRSQTEAAVDSITAGPYLTYLSQYRASIGNGLRVGSVTINASSPPSVFSNTNVRDMLNTNISNGILPDPATDPELLYMVIPQPGSTAGSLGGEHTYLSSGAVIAHYGWTINPGDLDSITYYFSHELAEAVSDPEGTAVQVNPRNPTSWNEICDREAQNYSYRLNGYVVNSWFSQADHGYVVPTEQAQNFFVSSSRVLAVNGDQLHNGQDTITIDQENDGYKVTLNGEVAQFDARDFFRPGTLAVSSITVNTGSSDATVDLESTISGRPVTVNLGDGTDTVNISPAAQNLSDLAGTVTVNGGTGFDSLFVWDQYNTAGRTFTVTGTTIAPSGAATLTYGSLSNLVLLAGNGGNTFNLQGTSAPITLKGGGGPNTLVGSSAANTWSIVGTDGGFLSSTSIAGSVAFSSIQNLTGGAAANTFVYSDGAGVSGNLDGGSGGGSLDYSAYSTSVIVDLQTATATGVGGTIANIRNVTGGNGGGAGVYNILVGNGGNILIGGNGRGNLLIAGSSASMLIGGADDDILIGGTTAYDMNLAALMAIMDYWSGTSDDYATRVGNLLAGNGVPLLDATTVISNGGGNTLTGEPGLNLYYGNSSDNTDFDPSSSAVFVPV